MTDVKIQVRKALQGLLIAAAFAVGGCTVTDGPTTKPSTVTDAQNNALSDPFGYAPAKDSSDISGGAINEYDRNAMKKDLNDALNP